MRDLTLKVLIATIIPAFFLLLIEGAARIFLVYAPATMAPQLLQMPTWMATDQNAQTAGQKVKVGKQDLEWMSLFEEGEGFRVRLKPGIDIRLPNTFSTLPNDDTFLLRSNSLGFRGPELSPGRNSDKIRVLVFGDSSSFGWGVDQDKTFSTLLESQLSSKLGRPVEVGNFAMPGDSSAYGKLIFEKFAPQFPADIVIFGFGANDAKTAYVTHSAQVHKYKDTSWLNSIASIARGSAAYRLVEHKARFGKPPSGPPTQHGVPVKEYGENLKSMADTAKTLGAKQTMILELCTPSRYVKEAMKAATASHSEFLNGQELLINAIEDLKAHRLYPEDVVAYEARFMDSLRSNDRFYVTSDMCHANTIGHRLLAEKITERLG